MQEAFISPALGPMIIAGQQALSGVQQQGPRKFVGDVIKTYQNMSPEKQEALRNAGTNALQKVQEKIRNRKTRLYGNGGGDVDGGSSSGGESRSYGLSPAPKPTPVSLSTGIKPNTYTSDYMQSVEGKCSPLHLTGVNMKIPSTSTYTLYTYFKSIIAFDFQSRAQAAVTFNINISTKFTADKILTAMNSVLDALQVYYWYASILTYHSSPLNKNDGMIYLRSQISATDIQNFYLLKTRLEGTPIPPNMVGIVRYLSANWFSGDTQGSTIVKIAPKAMTAAGIAGSNLTTALSAIDTDDNNEVFSIIRKCVPSWVQELPDVPLFPTYDANFLTIWGNLPFITWNGTVGTQYPVAATFDTTVEYCSWTNDLDGFAFALNSLYSTNYQPGLITPLAGHLGSNRYSYYTQSGVSGLYDSNQRTFLIKSRAETYYVSTVTGQVVESAHLPGTDKCQQVTVNTILETSQKAMDYLMSLETIKPRSLTKAPGATRESGTGGRRGRKRK